MGRAKLFKFLKDHDLQMKSKKKVIKTTNSYHYYHCYPNLIKELTPIRKVTAIIETNNSRIISLNYLLITNILKYSPISLTRIIH